MARLCAITLGVIVSALGWNPDPAHADEGILEINQACALVGCFGGDTAGFPVTISAPGSYRLTSSLAQQSDGGSPAAATAILITASHVTLDLRGFSISCSDSSASCTGFGDGIASSGLSIQGLKIHDGVIFGMPSDGINIASNDVHVANVRAYENGGDGIRTGSALTTGGLVESCIASDNGGNGIAVGLKVIIRACSATGNGSFDLRGFTLSGGPVSGYTECVTDGNVGNLVNIGSNLP